MFKRKKNSGELKSLSVCLTPTLIGNYKIDDAIVVVIDILRATTSMCVAFHNGINKIKTFAEVEDCRKQRENGFLIAAERNGEKVDGFDFGNSPYSYMSENIRGKNLAMTTTNGTQAIEAAKSAKKIVIGAFSNLTVLSEFLVAQNENVVLLCSGWKTRINLEDSIFAGAVAAHIKQYFKINDDSAILAETLYHQANKRKRRYIESSSHHRRMLHLNLQKDVKFSFKQDTCPVLPVMNEEGYLENVLQEKAL